MKYKNSAQFRNNLFAVDACLTLLCNLSKCFASTCLLYCVSANSRSRRRSVASILCFVSCERDRWLSAIFKDLEDHRSTGTIRKRARLGVTIDGAGESAMGWDIVVLANHITEER